MREPAAPIILLSLVPAPLAPHAVACEESVSSALPALYRTALRLPRIRFPARLACSSAE